MTGFYLAVLSHPTGAPETFMVYLEVFYENYDCYIFDGAFFHNSYNYYTTK